MYIEPEADMTNNDAKTMNPSTKEHMQAEALNGSPTPTTTSELSHRHFLLS